MTVVVPHTGEVVDLQDASDDLLAAVQVELAARERDYADHRRLIERELAARMTRDNQATRHTTGGHRIDLRTSHTRVWDADELEHVCRDLADHGTIAAGQYTGLIRHETKVDGRVAQRLLGALVGQARHAVEACFTWREGNTTLTVTPPEPPAIEATAEDDDG